LTLVYGNDIELCEWAGLVVCQDKSAFSQPAKAIGIIDNGKLICAVVYNNYRPSKIGSIEMSIASIDKRWATRHNLRALFSYPFAQLNLGRVEAHCQAQDEGVINFLTRLGFVREGLHRQAYHDGSDALSFSMLRHECRWLGDNNGQENAKSSGSARSDSNRAGANSVQ
jgi:hypothetical protein